MDDDEGIGIGMVIGILFTLSLLWSFNVFEPETKELGQSICDQEYNLSFDIYSNGVLKCKPKDIKAEVQYDGIVIEIGDGR